MKKYKIEKNVPIPGSTSKYPFDELKEIGDSFWWKVSCQSIYNSAKYWARMNNKKWDFLTKRENGGTRIWRIK